MIVDTEEDCYRALGVIHRAWPTVPERFKDFISTPKRNNYRSLHTTVVGPKGMRIEMQIRTEAMDRVAEEGVAAHWRYKDQSYGFDAEAAEGAGGRDPLSTCATSSRCWSTAATSRSWSSTPSSRCSSTRCSSSRPRASWSACRTGRMPLDFAYAVHTDVGDTTIGVKINGELKPLRTALTTATWSR